MTFNYTVRHNGIDYLPGQDVPVEEEKKEKVVVEPVVEEKVAKTTENKAQNRSKRARK